MSSDEQAEKLLGAILAATSAEAIQGLLERNQPKFDAGFFELLAARVRRAAEAGNNGEAEFLRGLPRFIGLLPGVARKREWEVLHQTLSEAQAHVQREEWWAARRLLDEAQKVSEQIGGTTIVGICLRLRARAQHGEGDWLAALNELRLAAEHYARHGLWAEEAEVLGEMASMARERGRPAMARELYQRKLDCAQKVALGQVEGEARLGLASLAVDASDLAGALAQLGAGLAAAEGGEDTQLRANLHLNLGHLLLRQGEPEPARDHLLQAADLFRANGSAEGVAIAEGYLARLDPGAPLVPAEPAAPEASPEEVRSAAVDLERQAQEAKQRGEISLALQLRERALAMVRSIGDLFNQAVLLGNLGNLYVENIGDVATGVSYFEQSFAIAQRLRNPELQAWMIKRLYETAPGKWSSRTALRYYEEAIAVAREQGDEERLAALLISAGNMAKAEQLWYRARPFYAEALAVAERLGQQEQTVLALGNIGNVLANTGDIRGARAHYQRGLELARTIGYTQGVMNQANNLGTSYIQEQHYDQAIPLLQESLAAGAQLGNREFQAAALHNLSTSYRGAGRLTDAHAAIDRAIKLVGDAWSEARLAQIYHQRAQIEAEQGALLAADASYAQACRWLERLAEQRFLSQPELAAFNDWAQTVLERIALLVAQGQHALVIDLIEAVKAKPFTTATGARPLTMPDLLALLRATGRTAALVHFVALRDRVVAAIVRADRAEPLALSIPLPLEDIGDAVQRFLKEVDKYPAHPDLDETWHELAAELCEPLLPALDGCDLVYLCPHQILWMLPLHAARPAGEPLVKRFPLAYTDSATRLAALLARPAGPRNGGLAAGVGLTVGDDALFEGEAQLAAKGVGAQLRLGRAVTRQFLLDAMPGKDLVHISAHGRWGYDGTELVLANESERLGPADLERCPLSASLVVLSGCDTGWYSPSSLFAGPHGLPTAFLNAGARAVLATHWPASAQASLQVVYHFYRQLAEPGVAVVDALRQAQLAVLEKPYYRGHTYYWAAFSLTGDWR